MCNLEPKTSKILLTAAIASLILILTALISSYVSVVLALVIVLFFPGYSITALLFPGRTLGIPARLLLSVALSLAATALFGLILHLTSWGIRLNNPLMILFFGAVSLLGSYFLIRDILSVDRATILTRFGLSFRQILLLVLAATVVTIAINIARTPASPENLTGYTLLGVLPGTSTDRLELEVRSEEFTATQYQLRFEINDVLQEGPIFSLAPGQTWNYSLKLDGGRSTAQPIKVLLYRLDQPNQIYRRVIWWHENN
jgi:hypothetical protein